MDDIYNPNYAFEYEDRPIIEQSLSILTPQLLRTIIGEIILRLPSVLSAPLRHWISNFNPDIIFSVLSTGPMVRMVVKVSDLCNIPIIPLFTDDWVSTLYEDHKLRPLLRHSLTGWFNACIKRSPISLTANDHMRVEYTRRYGGRFETMLFPEEFRQSVIKSFDYEHALPVRFIYIGSLVPDRWGSLRQIGEALFDLRSEGVNGELLIYTFPSDIQKHGETLTLEPVMRVMGTAKPETVVQLQNDADVLVHVESFHLVYQRWTAFSLSTKISQYLMAGACILAYGPGDVASMRHLADSGAAFTVGKEDATALRTALKKLIKDVNFRQSLGKKAHKFALEHHEATIQRELFRSYVAEACNLWPNNRE